MALKTAMEEVDVLCSNRLQARKVGLAKIHRGITVGPLTRRALFHLPDCLVPNTWYKVREVTKSDEAKRYKI
jgi:hypothetical protein